MMKSYQGKLWFVISLTQACFQLCSSYPSVWGSSWECISEENPPNKHKCRLENLLMMKATCSSYNNDNNGLSVQDEITQLLDAGRSKTLPNQHVIVLRSAGRSGWRSQDSVIHIILTAWMNISWSCLMFSLCALSPVYASALPKWGYRLLLWGNFKFWLFVKDRTWLKSLIKKLWLI